MRKIKKEDEKIVIRKLSDEEIIKIYMSGKTPEIVTDNIGAQNGQTKSKDGLDILLEGVTPICNFVSKNKKDK